MRTDSTTLRGPDVTQERLFSYVTPEAFVPQAHPLRPIREIVNVALREMDGTFAALYAPTGRESIPPEQLLRGLLLHGPGLAPGDEVVEDRRGTGVQGHVLTGNRNGFGVAARLTQASGSAERNAALDMLGELPGERRKTVGADKACDTGDFVDRCRQLTVTPHVAQNTTNRASRIDGRTTRHPGYALSRIARKLIETVFGDARQHGTLTEVKLRGLDRVGWLFTLAATVVNLRRLPKLLALEAGG